jgi:hypothetical protein
VVVNMVRTPLLSPAHLAAASAGTLDRSAVSAGLSTAGVKADDALVGVLLAEAADHASRVALEERGRDALAGLQRPSYELPLLAEAVDLGGLYELSTMLREQGMA